MTSNTSCFSTKSAKSMGLYKILFLLDFFLFSVMYIHLECGLVTQVWHRRTLKNPRKLGLAWLNISPRPTKHETRNTMKTCLLNSHWSPLCATSITFHCGKPASFFKYTLKQFTPGVAMEIFHDQLA